MNKTAAMKELKALGNEQAVKTYRRHGITGPAFGVRYSDLYKLQKTIGHDTRLAEQLFATGNHDARVLACLIADPAEVSAKTLDAWITVVDNQLLVDGVASVAARHPQAVARVKRWVRLKDQWQAATGWHTIAAMVGREDVPDALFEGWLASIEKDLQKSPDRVRYSMNGALISISVRSAALRKQAIAAAKRIGPVVIDHGDTSCKTPDAVAYIQKMADRARKKTAKKTAKKAGKKTSARKAPPAKQAARKPASQKRSSRA